MGKSRYNFPAQPPGNEGVEVDWLDPSSEGLLVATYATPDSRLFFNHATKRHFNDPYAPGASFTAVRYSQQGVSRGSSQGGNSRQALYALSSNGGNLRQGVNAGQVTATIIFKMRTGGLGKTVNPVLFSAGEALGAWYMAQMKVSQQNYLLADAANAGVLSSDIPLVEGQYYVATYLCDAQSKIQKLFINTVQQSTTSASDSVLTRKVDNFILGTPGNSDPYDIFAVFLWERALSDDEIVKLQRNPYRVFRPSRGTPQFKLLAAVVPTSPIVLAGVAQAAGSAAGALSTSIRLAGAAAATAAAAGTLGTEVRLAGSALAQVSAAGGLTTGMRMVGAAAAGATASGALTTTISLTGVAAAVASTAGTLAVGGAGLSGAAQAAASGTGALTTAIPLSGAAAARASASGQLAGAPVALAGAAATRSAAGGDLSTAILLVGFASSAGFGAGGLATSINLAGAAVAGASASGALTVGAVYARAPAGAGYAPQQHYNESRPVATSSRRPAATQRNNR